MDRPKSDSWLNPEKNFISQLALRLKFLQFKQWNKWDLENSSKPKSLVLQRCRGHQKGKIIGKPVTAEDEINETLKEKAIRHRFEPHGDLKDQEGHKCEDITIDLKNIPDTQNMLTSMNEDKPKNAFHLKAEITSKFALELEKTLSNMKQLEKVPYQQLEKVPYQQLEEVPYPQLEEVPYQRNEVNLKYPLHCKHNIKKDVRIEKSLNLKSKSYHVGDTFQSKVGDSSHCTFTSSDKIPSRESSTLQSSLKTDSYRKAKECGLETSYQNIFRNKKRLDGKDKHDGKLLMESKTSINGKTIIDDITLIQDHLITQEKDMCTKETESEKEQTFSKIYIHGGETPSIDTKRKMTPENKTDLENKSQSRSVSSSEFKSESNLTSRSKTYRSNSKQRDRTPDKDKIAFGSKVKAGGSGRNPPIDRIKSGSKISTNNQTKYEVHSQISTPSQKLKPNFNKSTLKSETIVKKTKSSNIGVAKGRDGVGQTSASVVGTKLEQKNTAASMTSVKFKCKEDHKPDDKIEKEVNHKTTTSNTISQFMSGQFKDNETSKSKTKTVIKDQTITSTSKEDLTLKGKVTSSGKILVKSKSTVASAVTSRNKDSPKSISICSNKKTLQRCDTPTVNKSSPKSNVKHNVAAIKLKNTVKKGDTFQAKEKQLKNFEDIQAVPTDFPPDAIYVNVVQDVIGEENRFGMNDKFFNTDESTHIFSTASAGMLKENDIEDLCRNRIKKKLLKDFNEECDAITNSAGLLEVSNVKEIMDKLKPNSISDSKLWLIHMKPVHKENLHSHKYVLIPLVPCQPDDISTSEQAIIQNSSYLFTSEKSEKNSDSNCGITSRISFKKESPNLKATPKKKISPHLNRIHQQKGFPRSKFNPTILSGGKTDSWIKSEDLHYFQYQNGKKKFQNPFTEIKENNMDSKVDTFQESIIVQKETSDVKFKRFVELDNMSRIENESTPDVSKEEGSKPCEETKKNETLTSDELPPEISLKGNEVALKEDTKSSIWETITNEEQNELQKIKEFLQSKTFINSPRISQKVKSFLSRNNSVLSENKDKVCSKNTEIMSHKIPVILESNTQENSDKLSNNNIENISQQIHVMTEPNKDESSNKSFSKNVENISYETSIATEPNMLKYTYKSDFRNIENTSHKSCEICVINQCRSINISEKSKSPPVTEIDSKIKISENKINDKKTNLKSKVLSKEMDNLKSALNVRNIFQSNIQDQRKKNIQSNNTSVTNMASQAKGNLKLKQNIKLSKIQKPGAIETKNETISCKKSEVESKNSLAGGSSHGPKKTLTPKNKIILKKKANQNKNTAILKSKNNMLDSHCQKMLDLSKSIFETYISMMARQGHLKIFTIEADNILKFSDMLAPRNVPATQLVVEQNSIVKSMTTDRKGKLVSPDIASERIMISDSLNSENLFISSKNLYHDVLQKAIVSEEHKAETQKCNPNIRSPLTLALTNEFNSNSGKTNAVWHIKCSSEPLVMKAQHCLFEINDTWKRTVTSETAHTLTPLDTPRRMTVSGSLTIKDLKIAPNWENSSKMKGISEQYQSNKIEFTENDLEQADRSRSNEGFQLKMDTNLNTTSKPDTLTKYKLLSEQQTAPVFRPKRDTTTGNKFHQNFTSPNQLTPDSSQSLNNMLNSDSKFDKTESSGVTITSIKEIAFEPNIDLSRNKEATVLSKQSNNNELKKTKELKNSSQSSQSLSKSISNSNSKANYLDHWSNSPYFNDALTIKESRKMPQSLESDIMNNFLESVEMGSAIFTEKCDSVEPFDKLQSEVPNCSTELKEINDIQVVEQTKDLVISVGSVNVSSSLNRECKYLTSRSMPELRVSKNIYMGGEELRDMHHCNIKHQV